MQNDTLRAAVVLLSGGLDSATTMAIAKRRGFACHALSFRYGQRHGGEIDCAKLVAKSLGASSHLIMDIDLRAFGGSALTDNIDVPKGPRTQPNEIPVTYVPARNTIFLSFALAYAEVLGSRDIFIGVNALDYSGYPDCRPEYVEAFERLASLATKSGIEGSPISIHAPLISMTKAEIIRTGIDLGVDHSLTTSCYSPEADGASCGECDACMLRRQGFAEAGIEDPTRYATFA